MNYTPEERNLLRQDDENERGSMQMLASVIALALLLGAIALACYLGSVL